MPDVTSRAKRRLTSGFGEGTVVKRSRVHVRDKPEGPGGRRPPLAAKAIISGPDNGFRVKPISLPEGGWKPPRPPGLPSNQRETLASFKTLAKPVPGVRPLPLPLESTDSPFMEPHRKVGLGGEKLKNPAIKPEKRPAMTTTLSSRILPPTLRMNPPNATTPARKVVPFHALPIPVSIPEESPAECPAESSSSPLRRPPLPKFDLGKEDRGKMIAMTALEPPIVAPLGEEDVEGEALELQRGLLVSPEKADRRRGKFIRNRLAEHAQGLINRSSTTLTLWKKETESFASRPGRLNADLRLRVKDVVHVSRNANVHSRSAGTLRSVLVLCSLPDGEERSVLLSFSFDGHGSHSLDCVAPLKSGNELLVWKPWQETKHPPTLFCSRFLVLSSPP